jgi:fatty-acid desaturase
VDDRTRLGPPLRVLARRAGGESLVNHHHAHPSSLKFSMARPEFDPSWMVIRALMRCAWCASRATR